MPYIKPERRKELDKPIDALTDELMKYGYNNMGDYNYVITALIHEYIRTIGLKYKNLNDIVGMLECCKAEFIRTVVSNYEDEKRKENGSVSYLDR